MISIQEKIKYFQFLNGQIPATELEQEIYSSAELEKALDNRTYIELISLDFQNNSDIEKLKTLLRTNVIEEGEFQTWKVRQILTSFLEDPINLNIYLNSLYHLYCGEYNDSGKRKYEFRFLSNLALNTLFWMDEAYMKANYSDNWENEYRKAFEDFKFYHKQLSPFAEEIIRALDKNQIVIFNDGTYEIKDELRKKLEGNQVYVLEHPDR